MRTLKKFKKFIEKTALYFDPTLQQIVKELACHDVDISKVRCGRNSDGGYVVAEEIFRNSDLMMSYGIADDISFELDVIKKYDIKIHAFDGGVATENFEKNPLLSIHQECVGSDNFLYSDQQTCGKISSYETQIKRLAAQDKKIFLKMDIEGAEYDALEAVPENLMQKIQGIVIELHKIEDKKFHKKILKLAKILNKFFVLYHVSGNNYAGIIRLFPDKKIPKVLELSYVNKNLVKSSRVSKQCYPSPLDFPNNPERPMLKFKY